MSPTYKVFLFSQYQVLATCLSPVVSRIAQVNNLFPWQWSDWAWHCPYHSASNKVNNTWTYISSLPHIFTTWCITLQFCTKYSNICCICVEHLICPDGFCFVIVVYFSMSLVLYSPSVNSSQIQSWLESAITMCCNTVQAIMWKNELMYCSTVFTCFLFPCLVVWT